MARARTRAVAARRTTVVVERRRGRTRTGNGSRGISLAMLLAGIVGGVSALQAYQSGGPEGAWQALAAGYTGYQPWDRQWKPFNVWTTKMLWPMVGAIFIHAVAQRTGVNRMVRKFLPVGI